MSSDKNDNKHEWERLPSDAKTPSSEISKRDQEAAAAAIALVGLYVETFKRFPKSVGVATGLILGVFAAKVMSE